MKEDEDEGREPENFRKRGDRSQGHETCRECEASEREQVRRELWKRVCKRNAISVWELRDLCSRERPQDRDLP